MSYPGGGSPPTKLLPLPGIFLNPPENSCPPCPLRKKHCSCILEGRLTTNPILSAFHLQGLKSNIYVHFHLINKPLNWNFIPEVKPSTKNVIMLESRRNYLKYYKIYISHYHIKIKCHFRMTKTISNGKS